MHTHMWSRTREVCNRARMSVGIVVVVVDTLEADLEKHKKINNSSHTHKAKASFFFLFDV